MPDEKPALKSAATLTRTDAVIFSVALHLIALAVMVYPAPEQAIAGGLRIDRGTAWLAGFLCAYAIGLVNRVTAAPAMEPKGLRDAD